MRTGECPGCRAPVEFRPGAGKVKVCEYCNTVVLRGEANLESMGKVAELTDTESPLKLGLSGQSSGARFTVVGRIQKANKTGLWDEWCLAFDDGRTGWLSESEGDWNLMFPMGGVALPEEDALKPLAIFTVRDRTFVVEEVNTATTKSAQGQLPDFNKEHLYADCTGPKGIFCSLDYANGEKEAFVGNKVSLTQLGFDRNELAPTPRKDALTGARCTQCNGPLALKAPDTTRRVGCPYCGALLDVTHGKLSFLQLLEKPAKEPVIPLGSQGTLDKTRWTVLAYLVRSCEVEGTRYSWEEYLLWEHGRGFAWLMCSNAHWTLLLPIAAGEVLLDRRRATYQNETFRAYQTVIARTDYVLGECYWQVAVGDLATAHEYVSPPRSINLDETSNEVTFTLGTMLEVAEVQKAFGLKQPLERPFGIASAQVNEFKDKSGEAWKWAGIWAAVLVALIIVFEALGSTGTFYTGDFSVPPNVASGSAEAQRFSEPFAIPKKVPLEVHLTADGLSNNWLGVSVDLVNDATGEVISVYTESSYYSGTEDGESWSEGSHKDTKQTAEVDPGTYVLRTTPSFDPGLATDYHITVNGDDGPGACCPFFLFLLIFAAPIYYAVRASSFETQRWSDSVFQA